MEKKKKKPKKARAGVRNMVSNLNVDPQDEAVNVPKQNPPPPTSVAQPKNLFNPEELKEDRVEFDLSSMNFPKIFVTKEDELADSLRPKRSRTEKRTKHMPGSIKKKSGNPKGYNLV